MRLSRKGPIRVLPAWVVFGSAWHNVEPNASRLHHGES